MFTALGGLMAERVTDLRDIERRIVAHLIGEPEPGVPDAATPSVLLADDLAPADTAGLDPARVIALATELGGTTSHTAIIARQLGIPCVVGVGGLPTVLERRRRAGRRRRGHRRPSTRTPTRPRARVAAARDAARGAGRLDRPGRDRRRHAGQAAGQRADGAAARAAAARHRSRASGCSAPSCPSSTAQDEPSVEEQADIYAEVLERLRRGRNVVVRTLDAGSDKPLAFATHEGEANPALGVRGLRLSFGNPGLLDRQLDAIAAAADATGTEPWVMAPMVATVAEAADFAGAGARARARPGVMVEVPSAPRCSPHRMLEDVDFLSIGTNDLTQYTMAADRMAADLAHLTDPWQPARAAAGRDHRRGRAAGRQAGRRLRRGGGRPAAGLRAGRAWASPRCRWRRPPSARSGARLATVDHGHLRGRRRGRARRRRPDGRPRRRPRAVLTPAEVSRRGVTVTGTPLSAALPRQSSSSGSVRSLIETPGTSAACAHPAPSTAVPVAVGQRHHAAASCRRWPPPRPRPRRPREATVPGAPSADARGRPGRRGASAAGAAAGPG